MSGRDRIRVKVSLAAMGLALFVAAMPSLMPRPGRPKPSTAPFEAPAGEFERSSMEVAETPLEQQIQIYRDRAAVLRSRVSALEAENAVLKALIDQLLQEPRK